MTDNNRARDARYICRLGRELEQQYGIRPVSITPAKRGFYGETWRVESGDGRAYFLKADYLAHHKERLRNSLPVIEYLCDNGIEFAGRVVKTSANRLDADFDGAVLAMFDWVDGENVETDETKAPEYRMLCELYALTKPGFNIPVAEFSDAAAANFFERWREFSGMPEADRNMPLLSTLERFRDEIGHCAERLAQAANSCRGESCEFYLTHGDAGGNFFVGCGRNYIFDWDEVMYAPLERDAWVMGCYGWARELFAHTLASRGICCRLSKERLAYYCYHMFFYLGEFLAVHPLCDMSGRVEEYLADGWIKSRVEFADTVNL